MKKSLITIVLLIVALLVAVKFKNFIKNNRAPVPAPTEQVDTIPVATTTTVINSTTTLGLNDIFEINGIIIKPWAVTQDSRCPSDVQCIQAGKIVVAIHIGSSTLEIEPGQTKKSEDLSITLDEVTPYPISTHKITDGEYKFKFSLKNN